VADRNNDDESRCRCCHVVFLFTPLPKDAYGSLLMSPYRRILCLLLVVMAWAFSCSPSISQNVYGVSTGRHIIPAAAGGAYVGAWANPTAWPTNQPTAMATLEAQVGHTFAFHTSYWGFNVVTNNNPQLYTLATNSIITDDAAHSRIPLLSWSCSGTVSGGVATGVTFTDIANGVYDASVVDPTAAAIKGLSPTRVMIRWAYEMNLSINNPGGNPNNNDCYAQSGNGDQAQATEYINSVQHLVNRFAQDGVTNVTWVWCPGTSSANFTAHNIDLFYPGYYYTDWIAGDTYDKTSQPTRGFVGIWTTFWNHYKDYAKPLMIVETGEHNNAGDGFTQQLFFNTVVTALQPGGAFYASAQSRIAAFGYFDSFPAVDNWTLDTPTSDVNGIAAFSALMGNSFFNPSIPP
jgi:hypothetical protein